jgi:LacI family transcriptional regulator
MVTIKRLAKEAGVSFSTVAKALNNDETINIETRRRIQLLAKKLNYRPNSLAKGLRSRRTKTIGVILNDLQSPFYSEIYKAIGEILDHNGYTMFLADSKYDEKLEKENILSMIGLGVEGLIISSVSEKSDNIEFLLKNHVKTVFIDNRPNRNDINCVCVDHSIASSLATNYLLSRGHKDILLLNGPKNLPSSRYFLEGYIKSLQEANLPFNENLVIHDSLSLEQSVKLMGQIFKGEHHLKRDAFSAIVTLSDVSAIGIYEAAQKHHYKIPDTYSVIGYDNIFPTKYLNPALTTIHQPKEQTGSLAANMLLDTILGKEKEEAQVILSPILIERDSVKSVKCLSNIGIDERDSIV